MARSFSSPTAFRHALEDRLKRVATARGVALNTLRQKLLMDRLLARLFADARAPWLLKGGVAIELMLRPRARATRDIDLAVATETGTPQEKLAALRERLQEAAERDVGDFFVFRIGPSRVEVRGAPLGGGRFPVEASLAGRPFGQFHVDAGFGDPLLGSPERHACDDLLAFAGIPPASVLAIPRAQQFAEKVHAYTRPRGSAGNTRTKDLLDLVLLLETATLDVVELRTAIRAVFDAYGTHEVPLALPEPPREWGSDYALLAGDVGLSERELATGFGRVEAFWRDARLGEPAS